MSGAVDGFERRDAIQRELDGFDKRCELHNDQQNQVQGSAPGLE